MITDLKPHIEYKASRLPWPGQVPAHWGERRMKLVFCERSEKGFPDEPLLAATQSKGVVKKEDYGLRTVTAINGLEGLKLVEIGDFVISLRSFQGGIEVSHARGIISPAYTVLRPLNGFDPRFFKFYFKSADFIRSLTLFVTGIREGQNVDYERLSRAFVPLPPPAEQGAIVRFLDWANGRLEHAIRAKRKVIALLNEQKQAIINRAVTLGLDPSVPLKPSGVTWLEDVPAHWDVRQLRNIGRLFKGVGGSKEDATVAGIPCVRYGELYFHYKNFISHPRGFVSAEVAAGYTPIRFGDVLFAASGERIEEIGKSAVNLFEEPAVCGGDIVILRPTIKVHAAFLGYALDSHSQAYQKATMCRGTTIKHIYPDELRGLYFCLPPIPEQEAITLKLDDELRSSNLAVSHLEREIELLTEYRTRLVADVVIGKLDVREAVAKLPEDISLNATSGEGFSDDMETLDQEASE